MKPTSIYLIRANEAIAHKHFVENGVIPKAYKGAVSAFGASLIMSGLVPTIQYYLSGSENRGSESKKIVEAIAYIIYNDEATAEQLKNEIISSMGNKAALLKLRHKITDAAIALKIMMRSFRFSKDEEDDDTDV